MRATAPILLALSLVLPSAVLAEAGADADLRDVLELAHGEVVRGTLERIDDGDVEFDSNDLDDVVIDFGDVVAFDLPQPKTFRFTDDRIYVGPARMRDGVISIQTDTGAVSMPRDDLMDVLPGSGRELDYWTFSASLSVGGQSGNTNQLDITARAEIVRETVLTRLGLDYLGNFSKAEDLATDDPNDTIKTANNHRASETFDIFLTDRFFVRVPQFEYYTDEFLNIDTRLTPGAGLGYEIIDNSWFFWDAVVGAAYQYTDFVSGQPTSSDAAVLFGTNLNFDLPKGVEWDNLYKVDVVVTDTDLTSHHALSVLSFDIWGPLDLEATFQWDHIQDPKPLADGTRPEKNDYRYTLGFGLDF